MDIQFDLIGFDELAKELRDFPKELARANRNAANTTATAVGKLGVDLAYKAFHVDKQARLKEDSRGRKTVYVDKARQGEASAVVTFKGGSSPKDGTRIGLQHFKTDKKEKNIRERGWKPTVQIRRGGKTEAEVNSFYGVGKLEGQGIFQRQIGKKKQYKDRRTGRTRIGEQLVRQTGPSLKQMIEQKDVYADLVEQGAVILEKKMLEAIEKQLRKITR